MRVLWIEDHLFIGNALELWLQVAKPDLELSLDNAPDIKTAMRLVDTFQYQLVLLDWWLGKHDGETAIRSLRDAGCHAPIVVVSGDDRGPIMTRALQLGAAGYVPKTATPQTLFHTIEEAIKGRVTQPRKELQNKSMAGAFPPLDVALAFPELTDRQVEVFHILMRGDSDKAIARELGIAESTVKTHVQKILQVVGVHKRAQAAAIARTGRN